MFVKSQRVHFIGIGGIGMSGIAEILLNLGYAVSGSDLRRTATTERLAGLGATIFEGHAAANVVGSGVVVASSAVNERNPEIMEARVARIPVIQRAEMLAELMRLKYGIAVAGMHGKTTTTSMIATVLAAGGLDPTVVVGGRVDALGSNARLGRSQYLVAEADESDRSFLKLSPILAVVTNLDREHMDCYRDLADIERAFLEFMDKVPFYGATIACLDDEMLAAVLPKVRRRVFTYGASAKADFVVRALPAMVSDGDAQIRSRFEVAFGAQSLGPFELHVPGRHNVLNATAAVAIASQLEIAPEAIAQGLRDFRGVDRRFQLKGCVNGVAVIDDYGHHPTEIRATLKAARECAYRKLHVIFQPHRYSRTRDLLKEFAAAFHEADSVQILDIYAASEDPIEGVSAETLVAAVGRPEVEYAASFEEAADRAAAAAREGDAVLTLGAGSVSQIAGMVISRLQK
ncbi:UDP-N-acetylmuramate--alanine ligase [Acidisarcina polymorpha]|uniref:UDP-N-acetylmuramate--L-alanine ligase n=1 Tax=Acidisarcina polymorpha TaxID=2211140 RepID=A0A2Z5FYN2_9BACT|nr:UDP-N-acetylmuramate--L-alanine ligase [Acidisarcina polymorpha]AXC11577.1 UDP-N-acetylmuramate--alanine ligase [Acidisarcina polymorpha]